MVWGRKVELSGDGCKVRWFGWEPQRWIKKERCEASCDGLCFLTKESGFVLRTKRAKQSLSYIGLVELCRCFRHRAAPPGAHALVDESSVFSLHTVKLVGAAQREGQRPCALGRNSWKPYLSSPEFYFVSLSCIFVVLAFRGLSCYLNTFQRCSKRKAEICV